MQISAPVKLFNLWNVRIQVSGPFNLWNVARAQISSRRLERSSVRTIQLAINHWNVRLHRSRNHSIVMIECLQISGPIKLWTVLFAMRKLKSVRDWKDPLLVSLLWKTRLVSYVPASASDSEAFSLLLLSVSLSFSLSLEQSILHRPIFSY